MSVMDGLMAITGCGATDRERDARCVGFGNSSGPSESRRFNDDDASGGAKTLERDVSSSVFSETVGTGTVSMGSRDACAAKYLCFHSLKSALSRCGRSCGRTGDEAVRFRKTESVDCRTGERESIEGEPLGAVDE